MRSTTLAAQCVTEAEAMALARFQGLDEFTVRVLEVAWMFKGRKIPVTGRYIAIRLNARMVAISNARRVLEELKLWPESEKKVNRTPFHEGPSDPIRNIQASAPPEEVPTFILETRENVADLARRCVAEYDRAMRNLGKGKVR